MDPIKYCNGGKLISDFHIHAGMISFSVTTYNTSKTLDNFFNSFDDLSIEYEIVVVDNNSKDGTDEYFKNLKNSHVKFIQDKCNRGEGRNIAIKNSSGDYIIMLDADIEYIKLQAIVNQCLDVTNKNSLNHFKSNTVGVNITGAPKEIFSKLGLYPPINCYEDIYIWDLANNLGILNRVHIPDDYAETIKVNELTGTISEWRYSKGYYEYLKRWIEKSADIIFVQNQTYSAFKKFNKVDSLKKTVSSLFLYITGKIYAKLFIRIPSVEEKTIEIKDKMN